MKADTPHTHCKKRGIWMYLKLLYKVAQPVLNCGVAATIQMRQKTNAKIRSLQRKGGKKGYTRTYLKLKDLEHPNQDTPLMFGVSKHISVCCISAINVQSNLNKDQYNVV